MRARIKCNFCEKEFEKLVSQKRKFCSSECSGRFLSLQRHERPKPIERKCWQCGKSKFYSEAEARSREKRNPIKFCTQKCQTAYRQAGTKKI